MLKAIPTFLFILLATTVFGQKKMTQELIDKQGTVTFEAPKEEVYKIVKKVLVSNNFEIESESFVTGKINTNKKAIDGSAPTRYKQYFAIVQAVSNNQARVTLIPRIWIGDKDMSAEKVWVIKGPAGEIKLWDAIFSSIEERL